MAELCKKCFLETWYPYIDDISLVEEDIVMSEDNTICEGCGEYVPYVHHVGKGLTCAEYDEAMDRAIELFCNQ